MPKWADKNIPSGGGQHLEGGWHEVEIIGCGGGESSQKKTPFVEVLFACVETGATFKRKYYITEKALGFIRDLYDACGQDECPDDDDMELAQAHEDLLKGRKLTIGISCVNADDYWQLTAVIPSGSCPSVPPPKPRSPAGSRAENAAKKGGGNVTRESATQAKERMSSAPIEKDDIPF